MVGSPCGGGWITLRTRSLACHTTTRLVGPLCEKNRGHPSHLTSLPVHNKTLDGRNINARPQTLDTSAPSRAATRAEHRVHPSPHTAPHRTVPVAGALPSRVGWSTRTPLLMRQPRSPELPTPAALLCPPRAPARFHRVLLVVVERLRPLAAYLVAFLSVYGIEWKKQPSGQLLCARVMGKCNSATGRSYAN